MYAGAVIAGWPALVDGGKLLSAGQPVTYNEDRS